MSFIAGCFSNKKEVNCAKICGDMLLSMRSDIRLSCIQDGGENGVVGVCGSINDLASSGEFALALQGGSIFYNSERLDGANSLLSYCIQDGIKETLSHIAGSFSCVIYNRQTSKIVLFSDRSALYPIYYCDAFGQFFCCSFPLNLLSVSGLNVVLNEAEVFNFLGGNCRDDKGCFFENIDKTLPGGMVVFDREHNYSKEKLSIRTKKCLTLVSEAYLKQDTSVATRSDILRNLLNKRTDDNKECLTKKDLLRKKSDIQTNITLSTLERHFLQVAAVCQQPSSSPELFFNENILIAARKNNIRNIIWDVSVDASPDEKHFDIDQFICQAKKRSDESFVDHINMVKQGRSTLNIYAYCLGIEVTQLYQSEKFYSWMEPTIDDRMGIIGKIMIEWLFLHFDTLYNGVKMDRFVKLHELREYLREYSHGKARLSVDMVLLLWRTLGMAYFIKEISSTTTCQ